uniref:Uncharacterized protein n=1 Tax=Romanomermis culicivorax TaxID=13658 RepID=A0A915IKZ8_ROMCU
MINRPAIPFGSLFRLYETASDEEGNVTSKNLNLKVKATLWKTRLNLSSVGKHQPFWWNRGNLE